MVTGYDHLLFLAGVIFFLYRVKDVALYVTLFAVGHSTTLLLGVLGGWHVDAYLVDAMIGLSVVYKAFENIGGFRRLGVQPNTRAAVLFFGFFHGLGLATKLQDLALSKDGLITNMVSFNIGVEIGQLLALGLDADRVQSVATQRLLLSPCVCRQRRADGGRFRARGISTDGFLCRLTAPLCRRMATASVKYRERPRERLANEVRFAHHALVVSLCRLSFAMRKVNHHAHSAIVVACCCFGSRCWTGACSGKRRGPATPARDRQQCPNCARRPHELASPR